MCILDHILCIQLFFRSLESKRSLYDRFGEEGLKPGMASSFNTDHHAFSGFHFRSPFDVFREFFGGRDPFAEFFNARDPFTSFPFRTDPFENFFGPSFARSKIVCLEF